MPTTRDILREAVAQLNDSGVADPERDAQVLIQHVLGVPRHRWREALDQPLTATQEAACRKAIAARADRQPVSQILGRRAFWKHEFRVTRDTLDPRPETETLVSAALEEPFASVLDLGTGTGAILISVLAERPDTRGIGTDISVAALEVARENAKNADVCADFIESDWFSAIEGGFDLILSNPPYIALDEMAQLLPEVRDWEPRQALTDEGDGLAAYRAIVAGAGDHLNPGGRLMVEIGPTQGAAVSGLMRAAGLVQVTLRQDLDGRDRVVSGRKPQ